MVAGVVFSDFVDFVQSLNGCGIRCLSPPICVTPTFWLRERNHNFRVKLIEIGAWALGRVGQGRQERAKTEREQIGKSVRERGGLGHGYI